jgi:hypothetical protein
MNIEIDCFTKAYWSEMAPIGPIQVQFIEGEAWPIIIGNPKICSKAGETIYDHIHGEAMFLQ